MSISFVIFSDFLIGTKWNFRKEGTMEAIRDLLGRLIAYCDPLSGAIESKYKQQLIITRLSVGAQLTIVREGIATTITRATLELLRVDSHHVDTD